MPGHPARIAARRHKAAVEEWWTSVLRQAGVQSAPERAKELVILLEGTTALILIHGDRSYAEAAAGAAKRLLKGTMKAKTKRKPAKAQTPTAKPGKAPAAPAAKANGKPTGPAEKVIAAFGAREGTHRAQLLAALARNLGKPVAVAELSKAVYGREDRAGALAMVLKGALWMIENRKPGYRLTKAGERGAITFTLSATR